MKNYSISFIEEPDCFLAEDMNKILGGKRGKRKNCNCDCFINLTSYEKGKKNAKTKLKLYKKMKSGHCFFVRVTLEKKDK